MIVVCSFGNKYLEEFFENFSKHNSKHKVLIIQNDIRCKAEFYKKIKYIKNKYNLDIRTYCNSNLRELGSWWKAYSLFPSEEWYCFVHDNMFLKFNAEEKVLGGKKVFALATINGWRGEHHKNYSWGKKHLKLLQIKNPSPIVIFGCSFICSNDIMKSLKEKGVFNIIAKTRAEATNSERILGIIFRDMNLDIVTGTKIIPSHKNDKGVASMKNPVRTSTPLFDKIRSARK